MPLSRTNVVLVILLVVVMLATAATRVDYTRPNIEILPDMKYSPAWTAFEQNANFADGQTLRLPVSGTVPRGLLPQHFGATKQDALRAGEELVNPLRPTSADTDAEPLQASVLRGGESYRVFCITCHGATGAGDGPVAQRGFPPPPSLLTGNSTKMQDGQLYHIVTYGQGNMPGFAAQIPRERRWDLANYIRSLQPTRQPSTDPNSTPESNAQKRSEEEQ